MDGMGMEFDRERMVAVSKALSDPSRLEILKMLAQQASECCNADDPDGTCVCDFVERTGLLQSLVSYHMKILREADLVIERSRGKWKHYRLNTATFQWYLGAISGLLPSAEPVSFDLGGKESEEPIPGPQ
jgi:ArsR family transcriptional regulator